MPRISENVRESILSHNRDSIAASKVEVTDEMLALARRLSKIHDRIRVTNQSSGVQFYMPRPIRLEENFNNPKM
jgi:hypothetical protein